MRWEPAIAQFYGRWHRPATSASMTILENGVKASAFTVYVYPQDVQTVTLPRGLQAAAATPGSGSPDTAQHPCGVETGWRLQSVERVFGSQSLNTPVQPGNSRESLLWLCHYRSRHT